MQEDLPHAIALHRAGRLPEAELAYLKILAQRPDDAQAMQLLGLIACQQNDFTRASELIEQAIARAPGNGEFHINLAEVKRRMNRLDEAEASLRRAAELVPENAFVWYNLGVVMRNLKPAEAMAAFEKAIAIEPRLAEAHNNLGLLQHQAGDYAAAIESFRRSLLVRPNHAETENNLGLSLWKVHREHEAVGFFKEAIKRRQDFPAAHLNLGTALRKLGRRSEAVAALRRSVELDPSAAEAYSELGRALVETGRVEDGIEACRRAVDVGPGNGDNWHALASALLAKAVRDPAPDSQPRLDAIAALERAVELQPAMSEWAFELAAARGQTPAHPPDAFVRSLFEEYAPRFENHLVKELHYNVPQQLVAELLRLRPEPRQKWRVLDLGCGTGICGELLRPHASRIVGVDLAPAMVELARGRGKGAVYDEVICAPAAAALGGMENQFDVITAGDFFIYVGAMDEILAAAARALRPGGLFAFSLERHEGDGFVLHRRQRYAHSLGYVRAAAAAAGLREAAVREAHLRDDVPAGWIVVVERQ
ncbi:MAG TPA: tetratricopeptide repeat protein, partial [Phycisphaerae bacterium]|nr:tetratricopeptide repeat protein [Phycisphaerae bacterium]